ncbi:MAG: GIY-YIG nuclease family protein [Promethearchaeota archaeon]
MAESGDDCPDSGEKNNLYDDSGEYSNDKASNGSEIDLEQDFDPNTSDDDLEQDFDPNTSDDDLEQDFDPNTSDDDLEQDFDSNTSDDDLEQDFDPNTSDEDLEQDFDPNISEEDSTEDPLTEDPTKNEKENLGNEGTTTILIPPDTSSEQGQEPEQKSNQESDKEIDNEDKEDIDANDLEGQYPPPDINWDELATTVKNIYYEQEQIRDNYAENDIEKEKESHEQEEDAILVGSDGEILNAAASQEEAEIAAAVEKFIREEETTEQDIENETIQETVSGAENEVIGEIIEEVEEEIAQKEEITLTEEYGEVPNQAETELIGFVDELYREQETTEQDIENEIIQDTVSGVENEIIEEVLEEVEEEIAQKEEITFTEEYGEVPNQAETELVGFIDELYREQETTEQDIENEIMQEIREDFKQELNEELIEEIKQEVEQNIEHDAEKEIEQETSGDQDKPEEQKQDLREKYRQETGRRPLYAGRKSKGFIKWLHKQESEEIKTKDKSKENREEWESLLKKWINDTEKISKEEKRELTELLSQYSRLRKYYKILHRLIQKKLKNKITKEETEELIRLAQKFNNVSKMQKEIFKNFKAFRNFYYKNNAWFMDRIHSEREKFTNHLVLKLKKLNEENELSANKVNLKKNWKEILKKNSYKFPMLSQEENSEYNKDEKNKGYGHIYIIINKINNKVYIGQTMQKPKTRWIQHKSKAKNGIERYFYYAIRYYGIENFKFKIIETNVPSKLLDEKEREYIEKYKSFVGKYGNKFGYNLTPGGESGKYLALDKELLEVLISEGLTLKEIAKELGVKRKTVTRRLEDYWGFTIDEARDFFGVKELFEERKKNVLSRAQREKNPNYIMVDEGLLKLLITNNYTLSQISEILKINEATVKNKIKELWGSKMTIVKVRKSFLKKYMEQLIKENFTAEEIAKELNISSDTFFRYVREFWGTTFRLARKLFRKPILKILIRKGLPTNKICQELGIGRRTLYYYTKDYWGLSLDEARDFFMDEEEKKAYLNKTGRNYIIEKEISKKVLKKLIKQGFTYEEIAKQIKRSPNLIYSLINKYWNMSLRQVRNLYMKPLLKSLIEKGFTAREIALELNISIRTVYSKIKEFWNLTFKQARDLFKKKIRK